MERISYQDLPKGMFEKLMEVENFVNASTIGLHLLELVRLRVGQMNQCAYCVDMHHKELQHLGEEDLRLSSLCIWQSTPYFSEKERVTLTFTETLIQSNEMSVSDTLFEKLHTFFTKEEISYLALSIAQINTWTTLMKTFAFTPGKHKVQRHVH